MKQVQAWETEDGTIYESKEDAEIHEARYNLKVAIHTLCDTECWSGMSCWDVETFLQDNMDKIV